MSGLDFFIKTTYMCSLIGILVHFFWMTAFLIMTFISLDFVYRFSNIGSPWYTKQASGRKKLVKFCWIVSLASVAIPTGLALFSDLPIEYTFIDDLCFIKPATYRIIFFSGPVLALSTINTLCFIVTSYNIRRARSDNSEINFISDADIVAIFAKVALLMGVTWLIAILPTIIRVSEVWYVFQVVNGLQGVYIFVSFGLRPFIGRRRTQESSSFKKTVSRLSQGSQLQLGPVTSHTIVETNSAVITDGPTADEEIILRLK